MKLPNAALTKRRSETGNVFIIILVGIVLFASLSFFISRSMRSDTTSMMSGRKAELALSDFTNMATKISRAVNTLRMKGCSESELNFEVPHMATYFPTNDDAPVDKHCHVFEPEGGNIRWDENMDGLFEDQSASNTLRSTIWGVKIKGVGKDDLTDIVYSSWDISKDACAKYNNSVNITNPGGDPPVDSHNDEYSELIDNDFSDSSLSIALGDDAPEIAGKERFCYQGADAYEIINVILAR